MIELEKHIEILLLNNDCVIVPGFGGFMTHHIEARYDDADNMFLPPLRTLGFNPQLKVNDSLLAQSYIEANDISYPEALRRIESDVEELRQHLENDGCYELTDIGTLSLREQNVYEFTPCEAGILTPSLYGLYAFEMKSLEHEEIKKEEKPQDIHPEAQEEPRQRAITIPLKTVRTAAAACIAVLAMLLFPSPSSENVSNSLAGTVTENNVLTKVMPKNMVTGQPNTVALGTANTSIAKKKNTGIAEKAILGAEQQQEMKGFTIVMMSHVGKANAVKYIEMLSEKGFSEGRILEEKGKALKIVYGQYSTYEAAHEALATLKQDKEFAYGWILEI